MHKTTDDARQFQAVSNTSMHDVVGTVCLYYHVRISDLMSKSRLREYTWPRQVAMYIIYAYSHRSRLEIARHFERDPSSVSAAFDAVTYRMEIDPAYYAGVEQVLEILRRYHDKCGANRAKIGGAPPKVFAARFN